MQSVRLRLGFALLYTLQVHVERHRLQARAPATRGCKQSRCSACPSWAASSCTGLKFPTYIGDGTSDSAKWCFASTSPTTDGRDFSLSLWPHGLARVNRRVKGPSVRLLLSVYIHTDVHAQTQITARVPGWSRSGAAGRCCLREPSRQRKGEPAMLAGNVLFTHKADVSALKQRLTTGSEGLQQSSASS